MEINDAWDLEGNFNGTLVLPAIYTNTGDSGMLIQPDGQIEDSRDINADSMCIMDQLPLYSTTKTSWYSNSSEDMDEFDQLDHGNISHGHSHPQAPESTTLYRQTAFGSYLRPAHSLYVKTGRENLMKRCFKFLRKIDEKRRESQRLSEAANIQGQQEFNGLRHNKGAIDHLIAERNRRLKINQHFSLLHSLLPHNSKKDKYSVLSNTSKYMSELKHRVEELEQTNRALEESLRVNISKKKGCTSFDQRLEEQHGTFVYSSDEVVLEQSKKIPNQVDMRINVQIDPLSSPTSFMIVLLERLRELQLEVVSVESTVQQFYLEAHLLITQKGDQWESSKWKNVTDVVRHTLVVNKWM